MIKTPIPPSKDVGSYVSSLINQPWASDGRNCWRLVVEVQCDLFGRTLPSILQFAPVGAEGRRLKADLFQKHEEVARWRELSEPEDGAIALMRRSAAQERFFIHAGVWLALDSGGVLHTDAPHGVVFDSLIELSARGWVPTFMVPK